MTEQELISKLREGDGQAFKMLVDEYQHRVYNTAYGLLQQQGDAEDMAQEVFIQVYRSVQQFREASTLSTWIYRITVRKCLDHLRSRKRKKRVAAVMSLFTGARETELVVADFHHPGVALDKKEDAALLFKLIQKLPANQKTAFILNKLEDLSYAEIAAIMNSTVPAVDALLQRAKQNLRKSLQGKNIF